MTRNEETWRPDETVRVAYEQEMPDKEKSSTVEERLTPDEYAEYREALLAKRRGMIAQQTSQLESLHGDKHHLADLEEMGDSSDTESACEIMDLSSSTIDQIDRGLEKLEAGTYGLCEECGKQIPRVRLRFLPFAPLCIDCQRLAEEAAERSGYTEPDD